MSEFVFGVVVACIPWLTAYIFVFERELRRLRRENIKLRSYRHATVSPRKEG
ncbi:MAG: hypothetical protein ACRCWQ_12575 [Bacilli bacterium]